MSPFNVCHIDTIYELFHVEANTCYVFLLHCRILPKKKNTQKESDKGSLERVVER